MLLIYRLLALATAAAILAPIYPSIVSLFTSPISFLATHIASLTPYLTFPPPTPSPPPSTCPPHPYTTTILSLSPLLILLQDFIPPSERQSLITLGTPLLTTSPITGSGNDAPSLSVRTSSSAPLPLNNPVVACVLARAEALMGPAVLKAGRDDMGSPQMVRYTAGQRFDVHADWFARPRLVPADGERGRRRMYNRVATVFVVLESNATKGGETWFPQVKIEEGMGGKDGGEGSRLWRAHEDGGVAFRPVPGNALFWVNLLPNGTGDARVVHAGLPIADGVKVGMNIWPRRFFGPDA